MTTNFRHAMTRTDAVRRLLLIALLAGSLVAGWPAPAATAGGAPPHAEAGELPSGLSDRAWDGILAQIRPAGAPLVLRQVQKLTAPDGAPTNQWGYSVAISGDILVMGVENVNAAYIFYRNRNAGDAWIRVKKLTMGAAGDYSAFGLSVAISGDHVVVGEYGAKVGANAAQGAAHVYNRNQGGADNWGWVATLTASDGAASDYFGVSVAISGDTAVAGAAWKDNGGLTDRGAAYVFSRNQGGMNNWGQVKKLGEGDEAGDFFGNSVAVSGGTVVVGEHSGNVGANTNQGLAHIYARNQGGADQWGLAKTLITSDGEQSDYFGEAVAISEDTVVVGAPGTDASRGSAYVFARNQGGADQWGQVAELTASDRVSADNLGEAVAISGDIVVAGAYYADVGGVDQQGAAYVFARNQGGADQWGQLSKLVASDGAAGDNFGWAVALSGNTLVVGAVGCASNQGAAYVFASAGGWGHLRQVAAADGAPSDIFGHAVALNGDTLAVGAPEVGAQRGAVYVMARNRNGADRWGLVKKLTVSDGSDGDLFGWAVALSDDILVVGSPGFSGRGTAYVFARNQGGADKWGFVKRLAPADSVVDDQFGTSVAIAGDTIVVGSPKHDMDGHDEQGAAYIFARNHAGMNNWGQVAQMTGSDGAAYDHFGGSVAIAGETVLVGATGHDVDSNPDQGAAYAFARNRGGADAWGQVAKLTAANGTDSDYFGSAVAIAGDMALVGAPGYGGRGAAYMFVRNQGGNGAWGQIKWLIITTGSAPNDAFGAAVALTGDTIVVAAHGDSSRRGAAYVFARDQGGVYNWGLAQKLVAPDGVADDLFGASVAIGGNTILVGVRTDHVGSNSDQGSAHLFMLTAAEVYLPLIVR